MNHNHHAHFVIMMQHPTGYHLGREEIPKQDTAAVTYQRNKKDICSRELPNYTLSPSFLDPYKRHDARYKEQHEAWLYHEFERLIK